MIILWVVIIAGIALLARWLMTASGKGGDAHAEKSPVEILKRRYASGEIDREEFQEMKKDLEK